MKKVEIQTKDGVCRGFEFRPSGTGPWPGVLFFMDGIGIRPSLFEIGERLAANGYVVLLPDLFYRAGPYEPMDPKKIFPDPELRKMLMEKYFAVATQENVMRDTEAFLDHLAALADVAPGPVGTTGYCMGGMMSIAAAATYPDRIAAAAAYHAGRLVTDAPDSPHRLAPRIKARLYIAGASDDMHFTEEMQAALVDALGKAGVDHVVEKYPAKHGWVPSDTPVHDEACTARHWKTLLDLFDKTLKHA